MIAVKDGGRRQQRQAAARPAKPRGTKKEAGAGSAPAETMRLLCGGH